MKSILHIVNKSSSQAHALQSCLRLINGNDALILIENGIYNAIKTPFNLKLLGDLRLPVYALRGDLAARGYTEKDTMDFIGLADYEDFVNLCVKHHLSKSWL